MPELSTQPAKNVLPTWWYFWRLIRFRPRYYLTDVVWATVFFSLSVVQGLILRRFFNGLTGEGNVELNVAAISAIQLGYVVITLASLWLAVMAFVNFTYHGRALLIRNMFARILQMPGAAPLPRDDDGVTMSTGRVISTLRDDADEMVESIIVIDDLIALSVTAAMAITIMLRISPLVTAGTLIPLVVVIGVAQLLSGRAKAYRRRSRAATADVTGMIADMFNSTEAVKVADAEERIVARFRQVNDRRREAMIRDRMLTQLVEALSSGAVDLGVGLVLLLGAAEMYRGSFTVGDFALFASFIYPATRLMRTAGLLITRYKQVGVSVRRMENIMQGLQPGAVVEHNRIYMGGNSPAPSSPIKTAADRLEVLEVIGLTCRRDSVPAADDDTSSAISAPPGAGVFDIDLRIEAGTFTVVTGRIGSGKSTLLRAMLGLLPVQSGLVRWNGELVRDTRTFLVPPRVAYTGQVPRLFSDSLIDNILLGLPAGPMNVDGAVHLAVMEDDIALMAEGLDTMVGPRGIRLSGGQVQRTAAARMFVRDPELLVFDDLSSALDVTTEAKLWSRLSDVTQREGGRRATCLAVSHRHAALQRADQVVVLKDGRVDDVGALADLLERCPEMRELWASDQSAAG